MTDKLYVSPSPHLRQGDTTRKLMGDVIIALIPAVLASGIIFGYQSLIVMAVSVLSCVVLEYICRKVMKRDNTVTDLSAVVTGILLAFNLPVSIPLWMVFFGAVVAIVVVKQMFGGIGQNFVNPALTARIVMMMPRRRSPGQPSIRSSSGMMNIFSWVTTGNQVKTAGFPALEI